MNAKLQELVHDLLAGTQAGAFQWTETPEPGVYRLMLEKGLVRVYHGGPTIGGEWVGCTVLDAKGTVLHDVQVLRRDAGELVALYDLVDGQFQVGALDDLLTEVRRKVESSGRATAGQR